MASSSLLRLICRKRFPGSSYWISGRWAAGSCYSSNQFKSANSWFYTVCAHQMSTTTGEAVGLLSTTIKPSPWLMLPPAFESGANSSTLSYKFYSLAENRVISLSGGESSNLVPNEDLRFKGSSHGWLALYNPRNLDLFLYNPLSRRHVKLPDVRTLPNIPQENLEGGYGCVVKVIISCSPDEPDCRAMIIYNTNSALAFCCPGRSNKWTHIGELYDWDVIPRRPARDYCNFVYSSRQKVFFCITNSDELETWDLQDPSSPRTVPMKVPDEEIYFSETEEEEKLRWLCQDFKHLVVNSDGDLLVVTRYTLDLDPDGSYVDVLEEGSRYRPHKTVDFDIQK